VNLTETFDQLNLEEVRDYLKRQQEEHLQLEFKSIKSASLASADDRKNLAKCISGFANSSGGVIIWGIDARKNAQGIDCAQAPAEISSLKLLGARLNEFTGQATSPIVDGVRHKTIETSSDVGFAATLVPESISGPHMAKLGEDRYYKRSGDSFYRMEHFDLEDMFGRRQKPAIEIQVEQGQTVDGIEELIIFLANQGRAVARHVGFIITLQNVDIVRLGPELHDHSNVNAGRLVVGYEKQSGVIHPNGIRNSMGALHVRRKDPAQAIEGEVNLYCEGMQNVKRFLTVSAAT
jgi:hypothetical protein